MCSSRLLNAPTGGRQLQSTGKEAVATIAVSVTFGGLSRTTDVRHRDEIAVTTCTNSSSFQITRLSEAKVFRRRPPVCYRWCVDCPETSHR
jgi:hypothetical protein